MFIFLIAFEPRRINISDEPDSKSALKHPLIGVWDRDFNTLCHDIQLITQIYQISAILSLQVPQEVPWGDGAGQWGVLDRRGQLDHILHWAQDIRILRLEVQSSIRTLNNCQPIILFDHDSSSGFEQPDWLIMVTWLGLANQSAQNELIIVTRY